MGIITLKNHSFNYWNGYPNDKVFSTNLGANCCHKFSQRHQQILLSHMIHGSVPNTPDFFDPEWGFQRLLVTNSNNNTITVCNISEGFLPTIEVVRRFSHALMVVQLVRNILKCLHTIGLTCMSPNLMASTQLKMERSFYNVEYLSAFPAFTEEIRFFWKTVS